VISPGRIGGIPEHLPPQMEASIRASHYHAGENIREDKNYRMAIKIWSRPHIPSLKINNQASL